MVLSYDARIFGYDFDPVEALVIEYLNSTTSGLYDAIHVSQSTKKPIFEFSSEKVAEAYDAEEFDDYTLYYSFLLHNNIPLLVYSGEFDMQDGPSTQFWMKSIPEVNIKDPDYWTNARKFYYVKDKDGNTIVGGYYRSSDKTPLTVLTVPKSGHFVPYTYLRPT